MSDQQENKAGVDLSRRDFLGVTSTALTAAVAGLTVHSQEPQATRQAERDQSASNPGQENKPLLDENPNSNLPPPTDRGDIGPVWYPFDLVHKRMQEGAVFLEMFKADEFIDVSLNNWIRRLPPEMASSHLNLEQDLIAKIPSEKLVVIPG